MLLDTHSLYVPVQNRYIDNRIIIRMKLFLLCIRTKCGTWRMKETETKMLCMVRRAPPMSQSEFEDDNGVES